MGMTLLVGDTDSTTLTKSQCRFSPSASGVDEGVQCPAFGHRKSYLMKSTSAHVSEEESFVVHCFDLVSVAWVKAFETNGVE